MEQEGKQWLICVNCAGNTALTIVFTVLTVILAMGVKTMMKKPTDAKAKEDAVMADLVTLPIAECMEINRVCKRYGYGNVMEWASALWRYEARKEGFPESGCFVPTCPDFIKPEYQCPEQHLLYDRLVSKIMEDEFNG